MYEVDQYTVSLLHFEDGIKDETGKVWTAKNGATTSTKQSVFGSSGLDLDGKNQYLTCPSCDDFNFGSGDFTIDFYHANNNPSLPEQILFNYGEGSSSANYEIVLYLENNMLIVQLHYNYGATDYKIINSTVPINDTDWHHIAIARRGSILYLFIDGKRVAQEDIGAIILNIGLTDFRIGVGGDHNGLYYTNGYFDEFRISKGIARWTENFDPDHDKPPVPRPGEGKFLLTVTLAEEVEREYPLTKIELDTFVKWYDARANGTGAAYYTFDKFLNRKDYLVFDKILTFEVTDFTK